MPYNGQVSHRRPYPYDMYVGGVRVMLKPNEMGNLIDQKTRTLDQSSPSDFEYGSENPQKERTFLWTKLYLGFGQSVAPSRQRPRRYMHAERADLSIDGQWMKGPNFEDHVETIHASAGEVRDLVIALHSGTATLFAICENGVYRRTADGAWTASLTSGTVPALPGGQNPNNGIRFRGRYAASIDGLYVSTDTGNIWQYTGAAWVQAGALAGPGDGAAGTGECRYLEKVGDELWAAGDHWIVKTEGDPLLRNSWAGVIYIGDASTNITGLKMLEGSLFIFTDTGIYSVDTDGLDNELFPHLRMKRSATNGHGAAVWMGQMWVPFGDQVYRLSSDGSLVSDGLDQLVENTSGIKGRYVAGAGHNNWFMYEIYYDDLENTSYLIKHGSWNDEDESGGASFEQSAHHGAIALWDGKRAVCASIIPDLHPSGNDRLYVGFSDGTVEWCVLPRTTPNPSLDGSCEFTYLDSYVYLPTHHSNFQADNKLYRAISAPGTHLTNSEWIEVEYKFDLANPLADWIQLAPDQPKFTVPGQRLEFPTDTPVYSKSILFRVKLSKDQDPAVSPASLTPVVEGITVHEQVRPSLSLEYTFTILASSFLARYNGTLDRRRGAVIRAALLDLSAGIGTVDFTFPDGRVEKLTIIDYKEVLVPRQKRRDLEYEIQITGIQLETLTPGTIFSGLTYLTLEQYTHGELEGIL